MTRTSNAIRNVRFAVAGQAIALLVSFAARRVFISTLSIEYLGLDGLFANILKMLALAELGVGSAITYSLYAPLAQNDQAKIAVLMQLYKKAYTVIGVVIAALGAALTPLLSMLIKNMPDIPHIRLIYLMYVANSALSYFFIYKRSLIIADQKRYLATLYRYGFYCALTAAQIIVLLLTRNYLLYLSLLLLATLMENLAVSRKADQIYPFLRQGQITPLDGDTKHTIRKNVIALMAHKIGTVVVMGTDNLLISKMVGIAAVGIYSNYFLITNALKTIYGLLFDSVTASIGNLGTLENEDKLLDVFRKLNFLTAWIYGFSFVCLVNLFNPAISLWLGDAYLFSMPTVVCISISFYLTGMRKSVLTFKDALGLYWYDRYKPLAESAINLVVSILLCIKLGVAGIFLGTIISTLTTCFWIEPFVLFKYGFKKAVWPYFAHYAVYALVTTLATLLTVWCCAFVRGNGIGAFGVKCLLCAVIPNLAFYLSFRESKEFIYYVSITLKWFSKHNKL